MEHAQPERPELARPAVPDLVPDVLRETGRPLDNVTRARAQADLGADFSQVTVHTGDKAARSAAAIGARAYTFGRDVVFGAGRYAPGTADGDRLLRHELDHVRQQQAHPSTGPLRVGDPHDPVETGADLVDTAGVIRRESAADDLTKAEILKRFAQARSKSDFILRLGLGPVTDDVLYAYLQRKGFGPREDDEFKDMPHADVGRPGDEIIGRVIQRESPDMMGFVGTYERGTARELDQRQAEAAEQTNLMILANFMTILAGPQLGKITKGSANPELVPEAMPNPSSAAGKRMGAMLPPEPGPRPIPGATEVTQGREVAVSSPRLLNEYEQLANQKIPDIVRKLTAGERSSANRKKLAALGVDFAALMKEVGDAPTLTPTQRHDAEGILAQARPLGKSQYAGLRSDINRELRADPDLEAIAQQLIKYGDALDTKTGALKIRVRDSKRGTVSYESLNLEHKIRESDNPWATKAPTNLVVTDAPQNQQYLESLRQLGSIWPSGDAVENFVIRHQLNNEGVDFRPGSR